VRCSSRPRSVRALIDALSLVALTVLVNGCIHSTQLVPTQPSAITQELVVRSLERALEQLDTAGLVGRSVSADLFVQQAALQPFAKEFVTDWLEAHGVRVTTSGEEFRLRILAYALGTDRGETFFGIPSVQTPLIGIPSPEIALFKWVRNRGLADVSIFVFDGATNAFVKTVGPGIGRSKQDDFTILILVNFTVSDLDECAPSSRAEPGRP